MIIRRKVNRNFTIIPNEPVDDERLSFEALGLLTYLLSKPDNWTVHLNQLRVRGRMGRDKIQGLVRELISFGYILRERLRDPTTNRFGSYHYVVYDKPQLPDSREPQPENPVMAKHAENAPQPEKPQPEKPAPEKPAPENPAAIVNTDYSNTLRESSASGEAGADAPSVNALIWKESLALLQTTSLREAQCRKLIGQWCKRASSEENKQTLLGIVRAARRAGTGDPVAYVTRALSEALPPPPDPKAFTTDDWTIRLQAAINTKQWSPAWGPPPGKRGCLVPASLLTPNSYGLYRPQPRRELRALRLLIHRSW